MKYFSLTIIFLLLLAIPQIGYAQGKIDRSKDELNKDGSSNSGSSNSHRSSSDDNSKEGVFTELLEKILVTITYYSTIGNYEFEDHLHSNLTPYPYYNNYSGNYERPDSNYTFIKYIRFDLEEKLLMGEPNIFGNHLKAKIRPFQYFYIQADYFELAESLDKGGTSKLSLFNFNFCYDRIRFERFNLGWMLGANYVANEVNKAGFSYGFNIDIFVYKGFSLYSSMKWSKINSHPVNEIEVQGKFHLKRGFVSLGYEHLKIATPTYDFISVGGGIYF